MGHVEGLEAERWTRDTLHGAMVLLHDIIEMLHLADRDRRTVVHVVALNSRFVRGPAVDGALLGHATATNHCDQERIREIPPHPHQNDSLGKMRPRETDGHRRSPSWYPLARGGRTYHKLRQMEVVTEPMRGCNVLVKCAIGVVFQVCFVMAQGCPAGMTS